MKKSELRQIIREEIRLHEAPDEFQSAVKKSRLDMLAMVNHSLTQRAKDLKKDGVNNFSSDSHWKDLYDLRKKIEADLKGSK
jgi:hypothetical protein